MPIPPPGGAVAAADDWTDDPSFDLSLASSSTSSSSRSYGARLTSSPLRQMHVKTLNFDSNDDDFGFDDDAFDNVPTLKMSRPLGYIPMSSDNTPKAARAPRAATAASSLRNLQAAATVMGQGPAGVGTITRLGGSGAKASIPTGNVKARARALEKAWEADVDFDSGGDFEARKMSLSPRRLFDEDALDGLPDLEDEDQATLKASATLKAKLPPPRSKDGTLKRMPPGVVVVPEPEDDLEGDLVLPLSLTNLSLATQSQPRMVRPRASMASTTTSTATDWDSPSTPSTSGRKGIYRWGEDGGHGRSSDTSMTSASPAEKKPKAVVIDDDELEDDMEDGLELPEPAFFSTGNAGNLNKLLDRKRKQQYAAPAQTLRNDGNRGDDSFEDGLLFDNPRAELSHRRLEKNKRNRTVPAPFALGTERKKSDGPQSSRRPPSRGGASAPLRTLSSEGIYPTPRTRRTSGPSMPPPPVPHRDTATPRLRHQRSHHNLAPTATPVLGRKQSLASLQDAMASGRVRPEHDLTMDRFGSGSRLTMPTSSSMAKQRPPVQSVFRDTRKRVMEMPRRTRQWGDGTELEGIEDLRVDESPGNTLRGRKCEWTMRPLTPAIERISKALRDGDRPRDSTEEKRRKRRPRKQAMLIKNLGAVDKRKVVGEMTWNPKTLRWEGNEGVLRDFDVVASSTRPALITHFAGSSIAASPITQAPAVRIVGDMKFDPEKMCWVSLLPPEEDEPDPFEDMADDEDSLVDIQGTITRTAARKLVSIGFPGAPSSAPSSAISNRFVSESTSIAQSTASWEERARPLPVPESLIAECKEAEERHRREMRGWIMRPVASASDARDRERREEKRLWEVRNLALRS